MTVFGGIDSGAAATKAVLIDAGGRILGVGIERTGADLPGAARRALAEALARAGLEGEAVEAVWATGFGRYNIDFAAGTRTELDCHARGVLHFFAGPLTVLDIGGQDAKVIRLDAGGRRVAHKMNRKCAAGTGAFLEEMAHRLAVELPDLPLLASRYREELELGSFCTVFTATELLSKIRAGARPADLARAAYKSVVNRILEMEPLAGRVAATGGVIAHHPMILDLLRERTGAEILVPPHPQAAGALGAALAARRAHALEPGGGRS